MATPARPARRPIADRRSPDVVAAADVALERSLLGGIVAFRWVTWVWMAVVLALDARTGSLQRPGGALVAVAVTLGWTVATTILVRTDPVRLLRPAALATELVVAGALVVADWWVYGQVGGTTSDHAQSLGVAWPAASVLGVGVALGTAPGLVAGIGLGLARLVGQLLFWSDGTGSPLARGDNQVAAVGTIVIYALVGALAGLITGRLRRAEREVALARARDEVARTLHDGVLQTLAVVQRRSDDAELRALAREQELELRGYLADPRLGADAGRSGGADLATPLRAVATATERRHGLRTDVVLTDPLDDLPAPVVAAVQGAVAEALVNAAKHGGGDHAVVYVEVDGDELFCSVKDRGRGFRAEEVAEGIGIGRSIRARVEEVGGSVEIDGNPGHGTEVRLRVPRR